MANVLWLQGGACSGNTMSFLNAEEPTVVELMCIPFRNATAHSQTVVAPSKRTQ